ncbi:MAG TPA: sulfotransferase domain-containing protein [Pseudolabrys sp.]|nr:sulfotransferase domain-containing protein [Pseudolabrys sp.]
MGTQSALSGDPQESTAKAPQSGIVWLASYPKSGNTWTRVFLNSLIKSLSGEKGNQHINAIGRFTGGVGGKDLYAAILGFEPTNEHRDDIAAVRHEVQRRAAEHYDGLLFIKTHQALVVDRGTTTINFEVTAGAIYIVRNPLDVAISYAHHSALTIDQIIEIMGTPNAELPVTDKQVNEIYGTWSQHVLSWTRKPHQAIYVMRYEDMLAEPEKTFGGLARHLLFNPTQAQLAEAIKASSFEALRAQEDKEGFREKSKKADRFFREGRAGQWREILTPQQIDRIVKDHEQQMARFGYLPD